MGILTRWFAAIALSCSINAQANTEAGTDPHIRLGIDLWPGYYPAIIAEQRGIFKQHKLNVEVSTPENTDLMLKQFAAGQLDAICVAAGDIILLHEKNPDIRIVMITDLSAGGDALLALNTPPASLDGYKIGTNLGGFGELFVQNFLQEYRTSEQAVEMVNIDASDAYELLATKQVDIAHTWEPYVTEAKNQGAKVIYSSWQTPGLIPDILAFNGTLLNNNPAAVRALISAWFEALAWWQQNPDLGNRLIQTRLNLDSPVAVKGIKLMDRNDNLESFNNTNKARNLPKVVDRYLHFFEQKGLIGTGKSHEDILDGSCLD